MVHVIDCKGGEMLSLNENNYPRKGIERKKKFVSLETLVQELGTSESTVRRDLDEWSWK